MTDKLPLVSVVVPVYNVVSYLEECLDSLIGQTYEQLEIILVDDGSRDGSDRICDIYVEKDCRIRVLHQKNCGVVVARQNGVRRATGDYLCFVDADDRVDSGMIDFFIKNIGKCDLITSACFYENASGTYEIWKDALEPGIYGNKKKIQYLIDNMILYQNRPDVGLQPYLVIKMYRTGLVKDAIKEVDSNISYSEDRDLLYRCVLRAESVRITHESFYYYRFRSDSAMHRVNKNFLHDLNRLYLSLEKAFEEHPQKESLMCQLQMFITLRLYSAAKFMGFFPDTGIEGYVFPFSELEKGSRIVLYGAGKVGQAYYRQIFRQKLLKMVLWVDKDWKKYEKQSLPVSSPEILEGYDYHYLIIAVKSKEAADEIRRMLMEQGILEEKVLWRVPAVI